MRRRFALLAFLLLAPSPAGGDEAGAGKIEALMRMLRLAQDGMVQGDAEASSRHASLLSAGARLLRDAAPGLDVPASEAEAALAFALSGGEPSGVSRLAGLLAADNPFGPRLEGAAAWRRGQTEEAAAKLGPADAFRLRPETGAPLALVQAAFAADDSARLRLLAVAGLLAPGTLVEEAALRRALPLFSARADRRAFLRSARHYTARFGRSPYAGEFLAAFASGVADLDAGVAETADIVERLPGPVRVRAWTELARASIVAGNRAHAAEWLRRSKSAGPRLQPTLALYDALFHAGSADSAAWAPALERLDPDDLREEDRPLLAAGLRLAVPPVVTDAGPVRAADEPDAGLERFGVAIAGIRKRLGLAVVPEVSRR